MEFYVDSAKVPSTIYSPFKKVCVTRQVVQELTLPDYCADIGRVIDARARVWVEECIASEDTKLEVRAKASFCILYLSDKDEELHKYCFDCDADARGELRCDKEAVITSIDIHSKDPIVRLSGTRKLTVRLDCEYRVFLLEKSEYNIPERSDGLEFLEKEETVMNHVLLSTRPEKLSEDILLPESAPKIAEIICCDVNCTEPVTEFGDGNLTVTCDAEFSFIYNCENGGVNQFKTTLPITRLIEDPIVPNNAKLLSEVRIWDIKFGVGIDGSGENRVISLDFGVNANINAYYNDSLSYVADAYSTLGECEIKTQNDGFSRLYSTYRGSEDISHSIDGGSEEIEKILSLRCFPEIRHKRKENGRLFLDGECTSVIFAKCGVGGYATYEYRIPFEHSMELPESVSDAEISVKAIRSACEGSGDSYKLRIRLGFESVLTESGDFSSVCHAKSMVSEETENADAHALLIYYPDSEETLWSVAKEHRVARDKLCELNSLEGDALSGKKFILIPKN